MRKDEEQLERAWIEHEAILVSLPGADALIARCGHVPSFHDGEIEHLDLEVDGPSRITVLLAIPAIRVVLTIDSVLDLRLEGFHKRNILWSLRLRQVENDALAIELEPTVGIGGSITGRGLSLDWSEIG